jgi:hypothetical protein
MNAHLEDSHAFWNRKYKDMLRTPVNWKQP